MRLTEDVHYFLEQAGDFLRSRPALHTTQLTALEKFRAQGSEGTLFGWLERDGRVSAAFYRRPTRRLTLSRLSPGEAGSLAERLAGHDLTGVIADHDTATAFAEAWQRHTGATVARDWRGRLHRLGTLTPGPAPEGRSRGAADRAEVIHWCGEFAAAVGETVDDWATSRFAGKHYTFWETGLPVAMAGSTTMVAGMVRVDPVYTPARFRGRGYGGAVTAVVSQAALDAGASDVVLFTDPGNATSNALYQRLGYVPLADFTGYALGLV